MDESLVEELKRLEDEALAAVEAASDPAALEEIRIEYLGRKDGRVSGILRSLGDLPPEDRPRVGKEANRVKEAITAALEAREDDVREGEGGAPAGETDLSLPGRERWPGGVHPVTRVVDEIVDTFAALGFTRARGPDAETEWYNFVALNTPLDHPAANLQDTFYLDDSILLRSHTSPVQARTMEAYEPPIRIIVPGMAYRRDTWDPSHAPAFHQIEGLAVDEGITMVDLKATLAEFARRMWGPGTDVRFRPSYFPFTEPSAEVDVSCIICGGEGCRTCSRTGWIEIMGAGMVDPAVFENVGYDPERWTGWAFGMGPGRIAMLKYGIPDIRILYQNDVRFLRQFAG